MTFIGIDLARELTYEVPHKIRFNLRKLENLRKTE